MNTPKRTNYVGIIGISVVLVGIALLVNQYLITTSENNESLRLFSSDTSTFP